MKRRNIWSRRGRISPLELRDSLFIRHVPDKSVNGSCSAHNFPPVEALAPLTSRSWDLALITRHPVHALPSTQRARALGPRSQVAQAPSHKHRRTSTVAQAPSHEHRLASSPAQGPLRRLHPTPSHPGTAKHFGPLCEITRPGASRSETSTSSTVLRESAPLRHPK